MARGLEGEGAMATRARWRDGKGARWQTAAGLIGSEGVTAREYYLGAKAR